MQKRLKHQIPLVLSFIDYEDALDSADIIASGPIFIWHTRYVFKVVIYEIPVTAIKLGIEVNSWFNVE